jgi:hypothetical protein
MTSPAYRPTRLSVELVWVKYPDLLFLLVQTLCYLSAKSKKILALLWVIYARLEWHFFPC